jgi:hypothetical protein
VALSRYAPHGARIRLSPSTAIGAAAVVAALTLVCGPLTGSAGSRYAAAAGTGAAQTPVSQVTDPAPTSSAGLGAFTIHPSKISMIVAPKPSTVVGPFGPPGDIGALGIPVLVLQAYHKAADELAVEQPSCHLPWSLLAGIGHTESGHAESGRLLADGTTRGRILGPVLNGGILGDAVIADTDRGRLDGDVHFDRAVGPMQFIPSTWRRWAADGNGDGKKDPNNIFDATLAAGRYLCADGRNLATTAGLQAAVLSYNNSVAYLATVLAWTEAYQHGVIAVADLLKPVVTDVVTVRPPLSARPPRTTTTRVIRVPAHPAPSTSAPKPSCTPTATRSASSGGSNSSSSSESDEASSSADGASPAPNTTGAGATRSAGDSPSTSSSGASSSSSVSASPSPKPCGS